MNSCGVLSFKAPFRRSGVDDTGENDNREFVDDVDKNAMEGDGYCPI